MERFIQYLKATKAELKHVSWPTQRQTAIYASLVIGISIAVSAFIFLFDQLFAEFLRVIGVNF